MSPPEFATSPTADQLASELQSVVVDINTFLSGWLSRAPAELGSQSTDVAAKAALKMEIEAFHQKQQQWAEKCESQRRFIEDQAEQLAQAWLHLETEQRQFLQLKDRKQTPTREPVAQPQPAACQPEQPEIEPPKCSTPVAVSREPGRITNNAVAGPRSDTAIQQFQRMRREIDRGRSDWNAF